MATITINETTRKAAEDFLEEFLSEKMPNEDLSRGTALRDQLITGMSYIVAYLREEMLRTRNLQSLSKAALLDDSIERDEAVDDILSNIFITRKSGRYARGVINIHLSRAVDVLVPASARFNKAAGISFRPDTAEDVLYTTDDLTQVVGADGVVTGYILRLNVVATAVGVTHNIAQGTFASYTRLNTYMTSVSNDSVFTGGGGLESTKDLIARASTAMSMRNLTSATSISTLLRDLFTDVDHVYVSGMGSPEMYRDSLSDVLPSMGVHTGGFSDIYVHTPLLTNQKWGWAIGGTFTDPREEITLFRDQGVSFTSYPTLGVGSVLKVNNPGAGEPTLFTVVEVQSGYLRVSSKTPFPRVRDATDPVSYSIGNLTPYTDIIPSRTTGQFTRTVSKPYSVFLPPTPMYHIRDVAVVDKLSRVSIPTRVNHTPGPLEYRIVGHNPLEVPSANQLLELELPPGDYEEKAVEFFYDTVASFGTIHSWVANTYNRNVDANQLVKAFHPVYLKFKLQYRYRDTSATLVDEATLAASLVDYINNFPRTDTLNVSDLVGHVYDTFDQIGSVIPVFTHEAADQKYTIGYDLYSPDGRVVPYSTQDAVTVDSAKLLYAAEEEYSFGVGSTPIALRYGISEETIRYLTTDSLITVEQI